MRVVFLGFVYLLLTETWVFANGPIEITDGIDPRTVKHLTVPICGQEAFGEANTFSSAVHPNIRCNKTSNRIESYEFKDFDSETFPAPLVRSGLVMVYCSLAASCNVTYEPVVDAAFTRAKNFCELRRNSNFRGQCPSLKPVKAFMPFEIKLEKKQFDLMLFSAVEEYLPPNERTVSYHKDYWKMVSESTTIPKSKLRQFFLDFCRNNIPEEFQKPYLQSCQDDIDDYPSSYIYDGHCCTANGP